MKSTLSVFCLILFFVSESICENGESENRIKEIRILTKIYEDCFKSDWSSCLKIKLVTALDRIYKTYKVVQISEGISFVNEKSELYDENDPPITENHLEDELPRAIEAREESLDQLLTDRIFKFFSTFTLRYKFSNLENIRNSIEEARGKGKKYGYFFFVPLIMAGTTIPLALGALALLAGKALIISKLALLLSGIIGLKKLFASHHEHHHGGFKRQFRSMNDIAGSLNDNDAHFMAYRGHQQDLVS